MNELSRIISVIPVYNGERFLTATLDSLAAQTLKPDRVIVLDDASTDDTAQLVEAYQPLKCELVRSKQNEGLFNNFNRALGFATECDFMHYICADDVLLPDFMQRMCDALTEAPAPSFSYCLPEFIDKDGNLLESPSVKSAPPRHGQRVARAAQRVRFTHAGRCAHQDAWPSVPGTVPHRHAPRSGLHFLLRLGQG